MAKKNDDKRLLDNWIPPADAGLPIGCFATTYTFQSDFFEEECLTRFLNIESKADEDGPVYLIEREEKLNNISCAAVWVDQAWARQKRNLRWDLVPVRLTHGILHSKVCVLQWVNCVRIIVGSANLTEQAYRKNQEIYAVIDLSGKKANDRSVAIGLAIHLIAIINADTFIGNKIKDKHRAFLQGVLTFIDKLPAGELSIRKTGYLSFPLIIEPGGVSFQEQANNIWSTHVSSTPPEECFITSPFFDSPEQKNLPAIKLWEMLKKKGKASVDIYTTGENDVEGNPFRIHAPKSIDESKPKGRNDVTLDWHILPETENEEKFIRPLHLKSYWFDNSSGWQLLIFGSSNFSSKGWGLVKACNYEANVAYLTNQYTYGEQFNLALQTFIHSDRIDTSNIKWEPLVNEEELGEIIETQLPAFFQNATLIKNENLFIEIKFSVSKSPKYFSIRSEEGDVEYLNQKQWEEAGSPEAYQIPIEMTSIPAFLLIYIDGIQIPACLTINVLSQEFLPPPDELKDLPLDILTQIITSATPLHQVLRKYLLRNTKKLSEKVELINPHDRVDTSTFLLQKTRKYSFAINTIKSKLEQPCPTLSSLEWRLYGPVGLKALVDAMEREASDASEAVFFLTELWNQLEKVVPNKGEGILSAEIVVNKLGEFQIGLAQRIKKMWSSSGIESIQNYSKRILEKASANGVE